MVTLPTRIEGAFEPSSCSSDQISAFSRQIVHATWRGPARWLLALPASSVRRSARRERLAEGSDARGDRQSLSDVDRKRISDCAAAVPFSIPPSVGEALKILMISGVPAFGG
jgi:hypothetical protein